MNRRAAQRLLACWPVLLLGTVVLVRGLADLVPLLLRDDLFAGDSAQHT